MNPPGTLGYVCKAICGCHCLYHERSKHQVYSCYFLDCDRNALKLRPANSSFIFKEQWALLIFVHGFYSGSHCAMCWFETNSRYSHGPVLVAWPFWSSIVFCCQVWVELGKTTSLHWQMIIGSTVVEVSSLGKKTKLEILNYVAYMCVFIESQFRRWTR